MDVRIGGWPMRYEQAGLWDGMAGCFQNFAGFLSSPGNAPELTLSFTPDPGLKETLPLPDDEPLHRDDRGFLRQRVYQGEGGSYLWVFGDHPFSSLVFCIDGDWRRVALLWDSTGTAGAWAFECATRLFAGAALRLGGLVLHGVLMERDGRGFVLAAPSGTGKTTHARLWRDAGLASVINGDRALCRKIDSSWHAFGLPWCGSSGECENRSVPLGAVVALEQHTENEARRLKPAEALARVLPNVFAPSWEPALYGRMLDRMEELIAGVPILLLRCRPDRQAVKLLRDTLDTALAAGG